MLQIERSVGPAGVNQIHDVAAIQLMLKLLYRGSGAGGPYYRGYISGVMDGATTAAVRDFFNDTYMSLGESDQKKVNLNFPVFEPNGLMFKQLASFLAGNKIYREGSVIKGTNIAYVPNPNPVFQHRAEDYLIPSYQKPKRQVQIGDETFITRYESVYLTTQDYFAIEFSLPRIGALIEGNISQPHISAVSLTKELKDQIAVNYKTGPWLLSWNSPLLSSAVPKKGLYIIVGSERTGLLTAAMTMEARQTLRRILLSDSSANYGYGALIPANDEVLAIAAKVQLAVCAGPKVVGAGISFSDKVNKITKSIIEQAPHMRADIYPAHCKTCANYQKGIDDAHRTIRKINDEYFSPAFSDLRQTLVRSIRALEAVKGNDAVDKRLLAEIPLSAFFEYKSIPLDAGKMLGRKSFPFGLAQVPTALDVGLKSLADALAAEGLGETLTVEIILGAAELMSVVSITLFAATTLYELDKSGLLSRIAAAVPIGRWHDDVKRAREFMQKDGPRVIRQMNVMRLKGENASIAIIQAGTAMHKNKCGKGYF